MTKHKEKDLIMTIYTDYKSYFKSVYVKRNVIRQDKIK